MSSVSIHSLAKRFGDVVAVDAIDLDVPEHALVTLLGPSGCGKSTLLRMIAGLERPTEGEIRIGGQVVNGTRPPVFVPPEKRRLGMVFQSYAIWPHMTVFQNVAYPLRARRFNRSEIPERVRRALATVELEHLEDRYASQLSGGQQQRVALARAIVFEPLVLLLDEPFSNLDARLRQQMREEVRAIQRRLGITTIFVTHDQEEALAMSDRLVVMREGRILQIGGGRDLYDTPADPFVAGFIGRTNLVAGVARPTEGLVETPHGSVACPAVRGMRAESVYLCVRPEHVAVSTSSNDAPGWRATVESAVFMGDRIDCAVRLGDGQRLRVHALPDAGDLAEGSTVYLTVASAKCAVIPRRETESVGV